MLRVLTDDEVKAAAHRLAYLYGSAFTIDNLTAILMDPSRGEFGMYECTSRVKAHAIIAWLTTVIGVAIPEHTEVKDETTGGLED